jgi:hypothetical protein
MVPVVVTSGPGLARWGGEIPEHDDPEAAAADGPAPGPDDEEADPAIPVPREEPAGADV